MIQAQFLALSSEEQLMYVNIVERVADTTTLLTER